ncbi:MAG: hypothetical protein II264_04600 [Ruminococcus sp.]|nr:hypothetical protein [Ruminococcus sp.]
MYDKGFFVLRSYYTAVSSLENSKDRGELWQAIMDYVFAEKEPTKLKPALKACFELIRPMVDSSKERKAKRNNVQTLSDNVNTMSDNVNTMSDIGDTMFEHCQTLRARENQGMNQERTRDKGQGIKDKGQGSTFSPLPSPDGSAADTEQGESVSPEQRINLFSRFWDAYPRKENKTAAVKAWNALKPDAELVDQMLLVITAKAGTEEWKKENGRFVPRADKWLSERRWEDERKVIQDWRNMPDGAEDSAEEYNPAFTPFWELSAAEKKALDDLMRR